MAGYKEYKSVTEFPLRTEKLSRDELEASYQELRETYRSLVISRGQLVRRQTEAKANLATMNQKLVHLNGTLERVNREKQELQKLLSHNLEVRQRLERWGSDLQQEVDDLSDQIQATTKLLGEFEAVYEEVKEETGVFSIWHRLTRLLTAAHRLLNTNLKTLMPQKQVIEPKSDRDDWTKETPANINRSLLDE